MIVVGTSKAHIKELVDISGRSLLNYEKKIATGDIHDFLAVNGGGRKGKLKDIEQSIIDEIDTNNYHSKQQIVDMIKNKFKLIASISTIGRFLKNKGIKYLKSGSLPAKADTEKQRSFYENTLSPLIESAKSNAIALLFVDASHFVMGTDYLGYFYTKVRRFVKTSSGRMRYNVLGALDMATKGMVTVTNDTYITATQVCDLLKKIADMYIGTPIYIILDNARYQKCKIVQECAAIYGVNLIYIPPYSPNLNLIERFWKHVKTKLRIKYYDRFIDFCETIDSICTDPDNQKNVDSLISGKVQLFDDICYLNESTFLRKEDELLAA